MARWLAETTVSLRRFHESARSLISLRQNTERRYYFLVPRAGRASTGLFPLSRNIYRLDPPRSTAIGSDRQRAVERRGRWNRDAARPYLYTFNKDSINGRKSYHIGDEWFLYELYSKVYLHGVQKTGCRPTV